MTTTTTQPGHVLRFYDGAPVLNAEPFKAWLRQTLRDRNWTLTDLAERVQVDEAAVRRYLRQPTVRERTVEKVGLRVLGEPRLPAILYPELGA